MSTMPVFVIKAKDELGIHAIRGYRELCLAAGLEDQAAEVDKAIAEMVAWRAEYPDEMQLPDHRHVPAVRDEGRPGGR